MTEEEQALKQRNRRRPIPGTSESEERLLAMVTALTAQLAVTRERVDTLERILARAGVMKSDDVENFAATDADASERDTLRRSLISKVFRPMQESAERDLRAARKAVESADHGT